MKKNSILETSEEIIEANICEFLMYRWAKVDKIISEGWYDPNLKKYRPRKSAFASPGISDILGCIDGRYFAIEVKTPEEMKKADKSIEELTKEFIEAQRKTIIVKWVKKELSRSSLKKYQHRIDQRKFLDDVIRAGGIWFFASSIEDVKTGFKEFNHNI